MAWRFRVETRDQIPTGVRAAIQFFDDTDPAQRTIIRKVFEFPAGTTRAEAIAQVKASGAVLRDQDVAADTLAHLLNPGDGGAV